MLTKSDESGIKCGPIEISWADIDKHGVDHWLNILSDKTWFTAAVESDFIAAVGKHYNRRGQICRFTKLTKLCSTRKPFTSRLTAWNRQKTAQGRKRARSTTMTSGWTQKGA